MNYDPHDSVEFIYKTAPDYAKAKGELAQLESFKHSLRSIKMAKQKVLAWQPKKWKHIAVLNTKNYVKL